jgi:general secretion pathway protein B
MSYILDALKKAERQRHLTAVPTVATMHRPPVVTRRASWPWIAVAAVLLANATVLLLWVIRPTPVIPERATDASQPAATLAASPREREPVASPPSAGPVVTASPGVDLVTPRPAPAPALDRKPKIAAAQKPSALVASAPTAPVAPPPSSKRAAEGQTAKSAASRAVPAVATDKPAAPPPPVAVARPPEQSVAPVVGPSPAKPTERSVTPPPAPTPPAPGGAITSAPDSMPQIRLQMLVYSDVPSERLVFINNHKYVEGQSVEGKLVVESITPDGAVVNYQGKRVLLRADPPVGR